MINATPAFGSWSGDFVSPLPPCTSFPPFGKDVSTTIFIASLLFPARSTIVIVSVVFFVYCFVNVFLSADNVQPVTACIGSLAVIVTVTTPFESFVYFIEAVGFVISCAVFPNLVSIVIGSLTFPFSSVIVIVPE